jgi:hypothetical protein
MEEKGQTSERRQGRADGREERVKGKVGAMVTTTRVAVDSGSRVPWRRG